MPSIVRFHVTDGQWSAIEPLIAEGGPREVSDRLAISGIVEVLRSGCHWRFCPPEYGHFLTIHKRYLDLSIRRDLISTILRHCSYIIDNSRPLLSAHCHCIYCTGPDETGGPAARAERIWGIKCRRRHGIFAQADLQATPSYKTPVALA